MATNEPGRIGAITLDQLIALNDEMAALVRAGIPLDRGLLAVGRELRGRAGTLAARLGERIESGLGLPEALEADGRSIPAFYRAVVEAGLRSGRLTSALEGLAVYARNFADTRRSIGLALLYPMMVLILAYGLFTLFILTIAPKFAAVFADFRLEPGRSLAVSGWLGAHPAIWIAIVPVGVLLVVAWWSRSARAVTLRPGRLSGLLRWVPGLGSVLALAQAADFSDLLATMVENRVALDEAIVLSAEATGSPALRAEAARLAEGIRRGSATSELLQGAVGPMPGMLVWVLGGQAAGGPLAPALRHAAETYRLRAGRRAESIQAVLPTLLLCGVGALSAIVYTSAVILPLTSLWYDLSIPLND